jgi:raffinose/stachyose/melibiose transport system permease protein
MTGLSQPLPQPVRKASGTGPNSPFTSLRLDKFLTWLVSHLILIFFTVVIVYPVIWMVLASFKNQDEVVTNIWGLPTIMHWENYSAAWTQGGLGIAMVNSTLVSLGTLALVIAFASLAAYALTRFSFRWLAVILLIYVFTMQTPTPIIPLYVEIARLHLTNTLAGLILIEAAGGLPLAIFIFRAFFQSVPRELMDAANVDGCSDFSAFVQVVIPISGPAIATVGILQFVGSWNEYFLPLLLIRQPEMRTIPLAIQVFFYDWGRTYWSYVFASLSIGTIPIIILYVVLARQFIQGLTAGAIKG